MLGYARCVNNGDFVVAPMPMHDHKTCCCWHLGLPEMIISP